MAKKKLPNKNNTFQDVLIYKTDSGKVQVEVFVYNEDLWLTQERIAQLFDVQRPAITKHLKNIFETGELKEDSVCSILEHTATDGKLYKTKFYSLDAIIAVGYRVNSHQATQFRIWATAHLKEFIIKGFTMDDERLKSPQYIFGKDYFDEQLERIRDIRSSERRFYQKITDIYAQCSSDYDKDSEITKLFFATVQNKLHWAICHHTAAELICERADCDKENMGLTNWKNAPDGMIRKQDVVIAKNYLSEDELDGLNRIVTAYLDYAEMQAMNHIAMTMKEWITKLNAFLQFNEKDVLQNAGIVSAAIAQEFAINEYEKYRQIQLKSYQSDFDKLLKQRGKNETKI